MTLVRDDSLAAALRPSSIAIIGASDNPHKIGGRPFHYLTRFGYRGRVYPVNATRAHVQGFASYPDVATLPEAPDLAVVAVPADAAPAAVEACARRGVRAAIVMSSGFGETEAPEALAAQERMAACARQAGMRLIGPNTQGFANFEVGAVASFSTIFLEIEPADGPVAIVSQSGVMSAVPYGLVRARGIGVRHVHATGNDADVTLADTALAVVLDPGVRLVLLYIESLRDPETLARAAALARERDVPIVAVKAGRTARGRAAARSHTGAVATPDRIVDAFFRAHGIWRARDMHDLVACSELYLKGWRPSGRHLVVVSNSGACGVMAADTAEECGLPLAVLDAATEARLARELPAFAALTNPVDITAALLTNSGLFGNVLPIVAADPSADLFFLGVGVAGVGYDVERFARDAAAFADATGKPTVVAAPQSSVGDRFTAAGVPTFANQTDAIRALAQLVDHTALLRVPRLGRHTGRPLHDESQPAQYEAPPVPRGRGPLLSESDSLSFLRACGMPVVDYRVCRSEAEAREAFRALGPAVVLKACSAQIPHKSEHRLVVLNLVGEDAVIAAFGDVSRAMTALGAADDGVIVAPMIRGRRELALGLQIDPAFGPIVMIADGGAYLEALNDSAMLVPPFTIEEVRDVLMTLRVAPILRGVRGEPPADVESFCAAAVRLGEIGLAARSQLAAIDLNPIIVRSDGEGAAIVDALVERRSP